MTAPLVVVGVISYGHGATLKAALACIQSQIVEAAAGVLELVVVDNSPEGEEAKFVRKHHPGAKVFHVPENIGFSGGANLIAADFLKSDCPYLCFWNPDLTAQPDFLQKMISAINKEQRVGIVTPKLLRADASLLPVSPAVIDAAGMIATPEIRHLDRGSGERDQGQYEEARYVLGGTGAALLLSRECVQDILLSGEQHEADADRVFPQLAAGRSIRAPLFDEAFFAYREDAELAFRAQYLGWRCRYEPKAVGFHQRKVTPDRRASLSADINRHGVRNRFLLQIAAIGMPVRMSTLITGLILRNALVILAVLLRERSSWPAFGEVRTLWRRAWERRRTLLKRADARNRLSRVLVSRWFHWRPYTEPVRGA